MNFMKLKGINWRCLIFKRIAGAVCKLLSPSGPVAIARTEHSFFSEREHAALEGLHDENRQRFSSCKQYLLQLKRSAGGPFQL